jgi:uroporphyrinogen-III decarboxylase
VLRQLIFPVLKKQVEIIHAAGLPVCLHSDGDIRMLLPEIAATGCDWLQGLESSCGISVALVRAEYPQLCCWGNLDPALFLPGPERERVDGRWQREIDRAIAAIVPDGSAPDGIILGTSSGLMPEMRLEELAAAYRMAVDSSRNFR